MDSEIIKTNEHLKLLKIFHYVNAGLSSLGIVFICFHFLTMNKLMDVAIEAEERELPIAEQQEQTNNNKINEVTPLETTKDITNLPEVSSETTINTNITPEEFMGVFQFFYLFFGITILVYVILNIISALFIGKKKSRIFSIVVAGVNCLNIPIGLVLGVFTILVLTKDSTVSIYNQEI